MADPVRKIKTIAMKDMARQALGWPARLLFPPVCAG
ncbi:MAG: ComF family protein, partial [Mesorhizobium sp.]